MSMTSDDSDISMIEDVDVEAEEVEEKTSGDEEVAPEEEKSFFAKLREDKEHAVVAFCYAGILVVFLMIFFGFYVKAGIRTLEFESKRLEAYVKELGETEKELLADIRKLEVQNKELRNALDGIVEKIRASGPVVPPIVTGKSTEDGSTVFLVLSVMVTLGVVLNIVFIGAYLIGGVGVRVVAPRVEKRVKTADVGEERRKKTFTKYYAALSKMEKEASGYQKIHVAQLKEMLQQKGIMDENGNYSGPL